LSGFVVIRSDLQGGIGSFFGSPTGQAEGFCSAVAAGSGHDLASPAGGLDDFADDTLMLIMREGRGLASGSYGDQEGDPGLDLKIDLLLKAFDVEFSVMKWGNDRYSNAGKIASLARTHELMPLTFSY
jgi:hypothetical protein